MKQYIDIDDLRMRMGKLEQHGQNYFKVDEVIRTIWESKLANVRKNVHGEWINTELVGFQRCSVCGALWHVDITGNLFCYYCPRCGANMRGENDEISSNSWV